MQSGHPPPSTSNTRRPPTSLFLLGVSRASQEGTPSPSAPTCSTRTPSTAPPSPRSPTATTARPPSPPHDLRGRSPSWTEERRTCCRSRVRDALQCHCSREIILLFQCILATCGAYFVICYLKVHTACFYSTAPAVQQMSLRIYHSTFQKELPYKLSNKL